jgi:ABC-type Na+ efflux pump permease subunit
VSASRALSTSFLVTPFRPVEIMVGKALPAIMVGMTQATSDLVGGRSSGSVSPLPVPI